MIPLASVVFPAPKFPIRRTQAFFGNERAITRPSSTVSSSEDVRQHSGSWLLAPGSIFFPSPPSQSGRGPDFPNRALTVREGTCSFAHRFRQIIQQLGRKQTLVRPLLRPELPCAPMQPHCRSNRCGNIVRMLTDHSGNHAGENIASPPFRHRRRARRIHPHVSIRQRNQGSLTL